MRTSQLQSKAPGIIVGSLTLAFLFGQYLPLPVSQFLYSVSLTLMGLFRMGAPILILSLVLSTILTMGRGVVWTLCLFIPCVCVSNFVGSWVAYWGTWAGMGLLNNVHITPVPAPLLPLWQSKFPLLLDSRGAFLLAAVIGAVILKFQKGNQSFSPLRLAQTIDKWVNLYVTRVLIPILPVMLFGFALKMQHDQIIGGLGASFLMYFIWVLVVLGGWIAVLWLLAVNFNLVKMAYCLKRLFPACIVGFTSMSSLVAMPLLLQESIKNTGNRPLTQLVVPLAVNVHSLGCSILTSMVALAISLSFGMELPSLYQYFIFSFYFMLAKFSAMAIPGGMVMIMILILEANLGFTTEMAALLIMIDLMSDCFVTVGNLTGNGAFVMLFNRLVGWGARLRGKAYG